MALEPTWCAAIIRVLSEAEAPLHYSEVTSRILSAGYYETNGATPAATVNAQITTDLAAKGDKSVYIRVAPARSRFARTS